MTSILRQSTPHIIAFFGLLLLSVIYFYPQLNGKKIRQGDVEQYQGMAKEINDYQEQTGERILWTNSMFGGMPTVQIKNIYAGNQLTVADKAFRLFFGSDQPIGRFFSAMIGFYILLVLLGVNPWLGIAGAIAFGLSTNNLVLFEAGHMTKVKSIFYFPLLIAGMILAFRQKYLWGGLLFALGLGLNIMSNHIQMTYYLFLTLIIYGIAQLVFHIRANTLPLFLKSAGVLILAGMIGIGSTASNLLTTYEYSKTTMRGEPILAKGQNTAPATGVSSSSETEGLAWDYAMGWSNGVIDLFSAIIPRVAGGSSGEVVSKNSPLYKDQYWGQMTRQNGGIAPLYWGELPFTSGPNYFGAGVIFLFILGLFVVKGPVKWWLGLGTLLTFLLSMGKNLEFFNYFLFEYFPLFNKFRSPNSVLSITVFLIPLLGILGLSKILDKAADKQAIKKGLIWSGGISIGIILMMTLFGPGLFDFTSPGDARYTGYGLDTSILVDARKSALTADGWRSLFFVVATLGIIWFYLQGRVKQNQLLFGIIALIAVDLWMVGKRYVDYEDFLPQRQVSQRQPSPANQQILQDKDPHFRVLDLTAGNPFESSTASYFHKSLGGYHAAKLQRYQDLIDRHMFNGNRAVYNMLNTKYFISADQQNQVAAQLNQDASGNAWFVDTIINVQTPNEEIDELNDFDPRRQAIVHQEFSNQIQGLDPSSTGTIQLMNYHPDRMTYEAQTNQKNLAVFSEIWYNNKNDWQAYIDDEPVDHIRVNYALRGLIVPEGNHTIRFEFNPKSYQWGTTISWICSSLILLGLIGSIGYYGYNYIQNPPNQVPPTAPDKPTIKVKGPQRKEKGPKSSTSKKRKKKIKKS